MRCPYHATGLLQIFGDIGELLTVKGAFLTTSITFSEQQFGIHVFSLSRLKVTNKWPSFILFSLHSKNNECFILLVLMIDLPPHRSQQSSKQNASSVSRKLWLLQYLKSKMYSKSRYKSSEYGPGMTLGRLIWISPFFGADNDGLRFNYHIISVS